MLAVGFSASALSTTALFHAVGAGILGGLHLGTDVRLATACVVLLACLLLDSGKLGLATPMWRRQTPQRLFYMFGANKGALLWGLDTGMMVTTYRVNSLSWAVLALSFLGVLPWWSGAGYAAGFVIPSAISILLIRPRTGPGVSEPHWVMQRIGNYGQRLLRLTPAAYVLTSIACVTGAVML